VAPRLLMLLLLPLLLVALATADKALEL